MFRDWPTPRTPLQLTLLLLLLRPVDEGWLRAATWVCAGAGLVVPGLPGRPTFWFALAALVAARLWWAWPLADNHVFLLAYWCLAIGLAQATEDPCRTLQASTRWLVALTFTAAVIWKALLSPEFVDGRFFRVTLLTDQRFEWLVRSLGGIDAASLDENRSALMPAPVPDAFDLVGGPVLDRPPAFERLADALTWGGLVLESAVAAVFLVPLGNAAAAARTVTLGAFCAATYVVAPVAGFGWLLAAMCLAHAHDARRALRTAIVVLFAAIAVFAEAPVGELIAAAAVPPRAAAAVRSATPR